MGQQQLLLLVLGIVIVGLAVVVGIQAFGENQKKANADALVNDGVRIASDAQAWKLKPAAFGGGSDAAGFTGLSFTQLGYDNDAGVYSNLNGDFELTAAEANVIIVGCNDQTKNRVQVTVAGTSPSDITTAISTVESCE
jgi:hypothetical protein